MGGNGSPLVDSLHSSHDTDDHPETLLEGQWTSRNT